jgi:hypothetical protein
VFKKIAAIAGALTLAAGMALSLSQTAEAASGNQFCSVGPEVCINAYQYGPWVKVWTSRGSTANDFTLGYDSTLGVYYLRFTGGGTWNNYCIGDANNDPNDARTAMGACPSGSNSGGWGTNFYLDLSDCGSGAEAFQNKHFNGYMSPSGFSNGSQYYLNAGSPFCFYTYTGA